MAPSIILVSGICSVGAVFYPPLEKELQKLGYNDVSIVENPSVDSMDRVSELQPNALAADINHLRKAIAKRVDAGEDLIVVGHSYGGAVSLLASNDLWSHVRRSKGQSGGVLKVALISAAIALPGDIFAAVRETWAAEHMPEIIEAQKGANIQMVGEMPFLMPTGSGLEDAFFAEMPAEERSAWAERGLRPSPLGCVLTPTPEVKVEDWRAMYLITDELDPSMPVSMQEYLIERAVDKGAVIKPVMKIRSGHFVQVTHAEEVAKWVVE